MTDTPPTVEYVESVERLRKELHNRLFYQGDPDPGGTKMLGRVMPVIERLVAEVMAHQVSDGYQKGYEHGSRAAIQRLSTLAEELLKDEA